MTPPEERSLGELVTYRLDQLEAQLAGGLRTVNSRLDGLEREIKADVREQVQAIKYVSSETFELSRDHINERIDGVRALAMWALGLVGAILVAVLGTILRSA